MRRGSNVLNKILEPPIFIFKIYNMTHWSFAASNCGVHTFRCNEFSASGEISKDSLVRSWPGNREEVVRRGQRTAIRRSGHPWSGASTFGEVR